MKKILRDTCILAALMILCVFLISIIWSGLTSEIMLVIKLFGLALILSSINFFIDEVSTLSILSSYIVKYFAVTAIVMLYGFIVGWFFTSNFWMAFIYVGVVAVLGYFLDSFKTKKDVEFINKKIESRKAAKGSV
ncbi:MAG: DUF3021 family protein [Lachnospiraceae bacterium]|jgi:hypothetical protein|nr:DUF3021 family protein [Lachnospiraceae bacterium]